MFDRPPPVHRFDEALEAAQRKSSEVERRSSQYVVGDANDSAERRADDVADRGLLVLRGEQARLPVSASATGGPNRRIQRSTNGSAIGMAGGTVDESVSNELTAAMGRGRCFEPSVQRSVRRVTGHDVSDVRVHTDVRADRLARSMQANAFTVDRNVFFARGQYRPDTDGGMHTVLHESAHLAERGNHVQRRTIRRRISTTTTDLDGSFKHETGLRGITKSMSSDEIPKIRNALKRYHGTKPGSPRELEELQILLKLGDEWLRKHSKVQDRSDQARMDLIDSIRTQAGMEFGKLEAASIYMAAGKAKGTSKPGAMNQLVNDKGFSDPTLYEDRTKSSQDKRDEFSKGKHEAADARRIELAGELRAPSPERDRRLMEAIESLSPAEYAAIHTYSGGDYDYINPNVGGWGRGKMNAPVEMKMPTKKGATSGGRAGQTLSYAGDTDAATAKTNRDKFEEAGMHAGFIMQAFEKLPLWTGTTYRGMAMNADFLGLLSNSSYKANDFWSSSESVTVAKGFVSLSASMKPDSNKAVLCKINVTNGRDVSRISDAPKELEILLPPGSTYKIAKPTKYLRGRDDAVIQKEFGTDVFNDHKQLTEFYLVNLVQSVNAKQFQSATAKSKGPDALVLPWEKIGGWREFYT